MSDTNVTTKVVEAIKNPTEEIPELPQGHVSNEERAERLKLVSQIPFHSLSHLVDV